MSASICSSSRRMPVRLTRSSTERKRGCDECDRPVRCSASREGGCVVQSCEQVLQKYSPALTTSNMERSSHPHFGQISAVNPFPSSLSPLLSSLSPFPSSLLPLPSSLSI